MSVRETIRTTHWARWVLSILAVLSLGACVPQYSRHDWSGLVSKTDALRFIAPASCGTPDVFDPVAADAAFFKIKNLQPIKGEPWTYNIELVENDGKDVLALKARTDAQRSAMKLLADDAEDLRRRHGV